MRKVLFFSVPPGESFDRPTTHPNDLSLSFVHNSIPRGDLEFFWAFLEQIYPGEYSESEGIIRWRVAPSLVTRGEAMIFGIKSRFALRAYTSKHGFINLRMVEPLREAFACVAGTGDINTFSHRDEEYAAVPLHGLGEADLMSLQCVADCVLIAPELLKRKFQVMEVELGTLFGEGHPYLGTPFVNLLPHLGGAACAQACSLMSTLLLAANPLEGDIKFGIHSPAEISAIVDGHDARRVCFGGFQIEEIERYFQSAGRAAFLHAGPRSRLDVRQSWLITLLNIYVSSAVPTIAFVDRDILLGTKSKKTLNHGVVIVGRSKRKTRPIFLMNDPAERPFVKIHASKLEEAMRPDGTKIKAQLCAVLPAEVGLPLESTQSRTGLLELAYELQHRRGTDYDYGEIILLRVVGAPQNNILFQLVSGLRLDISDAGRSIDVDLKQALVLLKRRFGNRLVGQWLWIQVRKNPTVASYSSLWVWWAGVLGQAKPESKDSRLLAHVECVDGVWNDREINQKLLDELVPTRGQLFPVASPPPPSSDKKSPEIGLISSFAVGQRDGMKFLDIWPAEGPLCEVFEVAPESVSGILTPLESIPIRLMAEKRAEQLAERANARRVSLRAIASFIPGIAYSPGSQIARHSVHELVYLVELARSLRTNGHHIGAIELVGGSRSAILRRARRLRDGKHIMFMELHTVADALKSICDNLRDVVRHSKLSSEDSISLALELEPGALFCANGLPFMQKFAQICEKDELLRGVVGFNVDVGHYALANATTQAIRKSPGVVDRIVHFHISDHALGHVADLQLGKKNLGIPGQASLEVAFRDWVDLASDVCSRKPSADLPTPSRMISLEFEAVESIGHIQHSYALLKQMLSAYRG